MCSTFVADFCSDISFELFGHVFCFNETYSSILCVQKRLFNLPVEVIINVLYGPSRVKFAFLSSREKQYLFSDVLPRDLFFSRYSKILSKTVVEKLFELQKIVSPGRNANFFDGYITIPKSIYSSGQCGA